MKKRWLLLIVVLITAVMATNSSATDNPITRKVKRPEGRMWVMMEVYPRTPWNAPLFRKKLGDYEIYDPSELNPKIVKMYYFPDVDLTIMVNMPKSEVMAWRDKKATK